MNKQLPGINITKCMSPGLPTVTSAITSQFWLATCILCQNLIFPFLQKCAATVREFPADKTWDSAPIRRKMCSINTDCHSQTPHGRGLSLSPVLAAKMEHPERQRWISIGKIVCCKLSINSGNVSSKNNKNAEILDWNESTSTIVNKYILACTDIWKVKGPQFSTAKYVCHSEGSWPGIK